MVVSHVRSCTGICKAAQESQSFLSSKAGQPRGEQLLERAVQSVFKSAIGSAAVAPAIWGLVAELNQALGFPDSAKDALKKQVHNIPLPF